MPAKASLESVSLLHATLEFKVTSDTQTLSALEKELSNEKIHLVSLEHKANRNIIATFTQSW